MSATANSNAAVDAVILAGGLARRMGGCDKGLVELAGMPMVQWVLQRVTPQVERVTINANRNIERYEALGAPVLPDSRRGHIGPLAGLATALDHFRDDDDYEENSANKRVFMCPCDSPFLPHDMVSRMSASMNEANASIAVATDGQRQQPVFLLVNSGCRASLMEFLDSGERKIDRWFANERVCDVEFADHHMAFRNINTEEELRLVEAELQGLPNG